MATSHNTIDSLENPLIQKMEVIRTQPILDQNMRFVVCVKGSVLDFHDMLCSDYFSQADQLEKTYFKYNRSVKDLPSWAKSYAVSLLMTLSHVPEDRGLIERVTPAATLAIQQNMKEDNIVHFDWKSVRYFLLFHTPDFDGFSLSLHADFEDFIECFTARMQDDENEVVTPTSSGTQILQ